MKLSHEHIMQAFMKAVTSYAAYNTTIPSSEISFWKGACQNLDPKVKAQISYDSSGRRLNSNDLARELQKSYNEHASADQKENVARILKDPLYAVRAAYGDQIADTTIRLAIQVYLSRLRNNSALIVKGKRLTDDERQRDAARHVENKLRLIVTPDIRRILFKSAFVTNLLPAYFSEKDKEAFEFAMTLVNGRVPVREKKGHKLKVGPLRSFASGVAASETGSEAQAKNPQSRPRNRNMKANRDGGPA